MDPPPHGGASEDQRLRERLMLPVRSGGGGLTNTAAIGDAAYYGSLSLTSARVAATIPAVVLNDPEAEDAHGDVRTFRLDAVPELAEVEGRLLADEKVAAALSGGSLASKVTKPQLGVQRTSTPFSRRRRRRGTGQRYQRRGTRATLTMRWGRMPARGYSGPSRTRRGACTTGAGVQPICSACATRSLRTMCH
jgi:hypothetical protein